ncbi:MAG TPA: hypothetical protein VIH90_04440 [Candidatus Saccharimonadales bacterium]
MAEQFQSHEDVLNVAWDAAQAANRAHDEYLDANNALNAAITVFELDLPGVQIKDEAFSTLGSRVRSTLADKDILSSMAAVVISDEVNPFGPQSTEADSNLDEIDRPALETDKARESIFDQLLSSHDVYAVIGDHVNGGRKKGEKVPVVALETAGAALSAFLTNEKLAYVAQTMEADPELRYTLVATPNVPVPAKKVVELAKDFGTDQPYETAVWQDIYDKYTPEELSGFDPKKDSPIKFALVSNKFLPELSGTVEEQRATLARLQSEDTSTLRVPSVVEGIAHAMVLRGQGDSLDSGEVFNRTYVRNFDLPEKKIGGYLCVPGFSVNDDGKPNLGSSRVQVGDRGRVAVG